MRTEAPRSADFVESDARGFGCHLRAPGNPFTVYGATPARDSAVLGFSASTAIAEATSIYLRYAGEVGGGTDNHALNVGLLMTQ